MGRVVVDSRTVGREGRGSEKTDGYLDWGENVLSASFKFEYDIKGRNCAMLKIIGSYDYLSTNL